MKNVRKLFLSIVITLIASHSWAALYENTFTSMGKDYLKSLGRLRTDDVTRESSSSRERCQARYDKILNDGVIDIRILMGYFDWTIGTPVNADGGNFGYSPSIDPGAYQSIRKILTSRCPGDAEFCEFREQTPYLFTKQVTIAGRSYQARIEMYYASVSEYFNTNTGAERSQQQQRSAASQAQFTEALQNADAVFYFGHSRNGGGPDFNPPVLISGVNKVNYNGYYKPNRPGLKKMLAALKGSSHRPQILGLMSCDSRDHFRSSLRSVAPNMGLISSTAVLKVDGVYTAMIGGIDAILRGQCQTGFSSSIRMTSFNQQNITMDGVF